VRIVKIYIIKLSYALLNARPRFVCILGAHTVSLSAHVSPTGGEIVRINGI
jgi:hypothetical protein